MSKKLTVLSPLLIVTSAVSLGVSHEPLEMYQKIITVPDKPVKINLIDRC